MKNYAKKLRDRRRHQNKAKRETGGNGNEFPEFSEGSMRIQLEGFFMDEGDGFRYCMEEVENVLGELSEKGEFAFGSFWGRNGSDTETAATHSANFCYESNVLQYHLIEMVSHII